LAATLVLTGFACEGSRALRIAARDAGETGGAAGGLADAPVAGTGGVAGAGGMGGNRLDAPMAGVGGSGGAGTGGGSAACGLQSTITSHGPTDVLLVLDRSDSMNYSIAEDCYCDAAPEGGNAPVCVIAGSCTSRWASLTTALNTILSSTAKIRWGLKLYTTPDSTICGVSSGVEVPISAGSAPAIATLMASVVPANNTPTAAAITAATAYLATVSDTSRKVILLATDGAPNCHAGGTSTTTDVQGTIAALTAAASAGFSVYVIGIGPSVGNLNSFAQAGGTATYYPATSPADLANALASISQTVTECTYTLPSTPPDPNNIAVYLDKQLVVQDVVNGWSFGTSSSSIVLNGTVCDRVTSGAASTVQVIFGCTGPPPILP
jgi:hypothetical protein